MNSSSTNQPNRALNQPTRVYLDHAASSPLRPEVEEAMARVSRAMNPAGQYSTGRDARRQLEEAREQIAEILGADPIEVIFTGSGTEADNIAVQGLALAARRKTPQRNRIYSSGIEHPAVAQTVDWLAGEPFNFDAREIALAKGDSADHRSAVGETSANTASNPPRANNHSAEDRAATAAPDGEFEKRCLIDHQWLARELNEHAEETALVTTMWANNETGCIQPIEEIAGIIASCVGERPEPAPGSAHALAPQELPVIQHVPWHVDAVQVVGHRPVNFHDLGADTLAASAHKFGGPRSAGILLARRDAQILSPIRGGGQERGLRSGTVNVQAAVGTAVALASSMKEAEEETQRIAAMRDHVRAAIDGIDGVRIWTQEPALPGHLHASFPGAEGDSLIMLLDVAGVDASTGSACSAGVNRASTVLAAMGVPVEVARGALRLTFGADNTMEQAQDIANRLPQIVEQARAAGMAY
ncbi:cysteine desulfurase family protein [Corynebacterium urogenitale]